MKRSKLLTVVVAIVLMVAAVSCTAVRYDEGYDTGYYQPYQYYGTVDPFTGFYYAPSPYYNVYGRNYSRNYNNHNYYRNNARRVYRERNENYERRNSNQINRNTIERQQQPTQNNNSRQESRTRIFGSRH